MAKKSRYELLLTDEIIEKVDYICKRRGSTRSATVNRLLSEYLEIETEDSRLDRCYRELEMYFSGDSILRPAVYLPGQSVLLIGGKSGDGLSYEIELWVGKDRQIKGEIRAHFECFSNELKGRVVPFFGFIKLLERQYLAGRAVGYGSREDVFCRTFVLKSEEDLPKVGVYIGMIDRLLKGYLSGIYTDRELEREFLMYLQEGMAGI
jgi:hypothetical protein